jgi:hypothetical protein
MIKLTCELSSTPVAADYARDASTLLRCERHVHEFDASLYRPETIERARAMWSFRMEAEHRSTSVFAALCGQIMEAGAPLDMQGAVLRMALDELRHAEVCAEVVRALGGKVEREVANPTAALARHAGSSAHERAARNVIYGACMSETVNCARFVQALETTTDPLIRDVTRQLLSDEAKHSQFGFHYLESVQGWLDDEKDARRRLSVYLRFAFASLERDMSARDMAQRQLQADERAIGLPDALTQREIFYTTVEAAIIPGLERFGLSASEAWKARALE